MNDVCLFAHFDRCNFVASHVWHTLDQVRQCGFEVIFVSACPLEREIQDHLRSHCADVIVRENAGLDFGSWAEAFHKHHSVIDGRLLLLNDSVYGPLFSLQAAIASLTRERADFYGMVESLDIAPHLQSWFVLLENRVVKDAAFAKIFNKPFAEMTKREIIREGEIGLSQTLMQSGFSRRALYTPLQAGPLARSIHFNPMHALWREMIERYGIPFLKVELLRDNPTAVTNLPLAQEVVCSYSPAMWEMIETHQRAFASTTPLPRSPFEAAYRSALQYSIGLDDLLNARGLHHLGRCNAFMYHAARRGVPTLALALRKLRGA